MSPAKRASIGAVAIGLVVLAACGAGSPSTPRPSGTASPVAAAPFAKGDMLLVTRAVALRDTRGASSPVVHQLARGDRVFVMSGPIRMGSQDWYEVGHHGTGGWLPVASDGQEYVTLDAPDPSVPLWDLVTFGDSSSPAADMVAERIEERLGVEVRIHDFSSSGTGGAASNVLHLIQTDTEARTATAGAEVVVIEMNPGLTATGDALGSVCLDNDPSPRDPPARYGTKDFAEYARLWRQVYDEVFALRSGQATVVRAVDTYVPVLAAWRSAGIAAECTAGWEAISQTVKLVAAEYGVPVASVYDAFNGPDHQQDPVDKGWIGQDGEHPSEEGRAAQVDVLDAIGWAPIEGEGS